MCTNIVCYFVPVPRTVYQESKRCNCYSRIEQFGGGIKLNHVGMSLRFLMFNSRIAAPYSSDGVWEQSSVTLPYNQSAHLVRLVASEHSRGYSVWMCWCRNSCCICFTYCIDIYFRRHMIASKRPVCNVVHAIWFRIKRQEQGGSHCLICSRFVY